ncbi:hypothetical protein VOLCADRAFT_98621 [Volvox carteri f. nagariensis]|uniref:Uncharacterized protein n=1 Tax=Volvox carteri f. nagariensis TaxID=3068 RepID=D8UFU6_VOLCA|nr:uncharacterized protein VOLCADRAFT_98621 [Volvox carteri f. nagariensis]EFJ41398.1 hypothetical protein VOLCADRAFT_98621 [Volvox carteri f. nagariensis]|eukprot:XP_002957504.1 hypothetical protein VOLCADRAFT_98621 [Volvox carteri f. nagariensis]
MSRLLPRLPSVAPLCFFLISVSYKLAWTAISSLLSQYSKAYGPDILLQLNVAYFFPSIPVLILQALFNDRMDRRLGIPAGVLLRFIVGLGGLVGLTHFFPQITAGSEQALLVATVLVGISYGVAFGTSYQVASKYPAGSTVALTMGFVSSGPVVLLLDLALKRGTYYTDEGLEQLFRWVAVITAVGLAAAAVLVLGSWRMLAAGAPHRVELKVPYKAPAPYGGGYKDGNVAAMTHGYDRTGPYVRHRGDQGSDGAAANGFHYSHHNHAGHHAITLDFSSSAGANDHNYLNHHGSGTVDGYSNSYGFQLAMSADGAQGGGGQSADESKLAKKDLPLLQLAGRILPAAACITISVGTSMLIFPFFTYMTSTGLLGERLAQVLFYIRLVGDILGRMVPRRLQMLDLAAFMVLCPEYALQPPLQVTGVRKLMFWAVVKLAMVPLLFGCIFTPPLVGGDLTALVVVALFWVLSGYLNTCSYLIAPTLVPPGQKSRASGLMTVAFQSACFGALMLAYAVQQLELSHLVRHVAMAMGASPH